MGLVLDRVKADIEKTIQSLDSKNFTPDPIGGKHFSIITSIMSSAYKRHGFIIERALVEALKLCPHFEVWRDDTFKVPSSVDHIVDGAIANPTNFRSSEYPFSEKHRTLQVDLFVFDKNTGCLRAYEIKRGHGKHDSGKQRSMLKDILCVQVLLKPYGVERQLDVKETASHVIFYYGNCSIPRPLSLTGAELDAHFGWPVYEAVEEVNKHYQSRLFTILATSL